MGIFVHTQFFVYGNITVICIIILFIFLVKNEGVCSVWRSEATL